MVLDALRFNLRSIYLYLPIEKEKLSKLLIFIPYILLLNTFYIVDNFAQFCNKLRFEMEREASKKIRNYQVTILFIIYMRLFNRKYG